MTDTIETLDIDARIAAAGIVMTATATDANPNMDDTSHDMDHWSCKFRRAGSARVMTVIFSMGSGHHGKAPTACDVLDCLASDATGCDGRSFEDWCGDYGYDTDSRKAERTWKATVRQSAKLQQFLGDDFAAFLYYTEKL